MSGWPLGSLRLEKWARIMEMGGPTMFEEERAWSPKDQNLVTIIRLQQGLAARKLEIHWERWKEIFPSPSGQNEEETCICDTPRAPFN